MNKKTLTVKLPENLHQKLLQRIIEDRYGMKGKSKWVLESIELFLNLDYYPELVEIADDMENLTDLISVRVPESLLTQIDNAIINVRREYPALDGVRSKIIRASIIQRLIRNTEPA